MISRILSESKKIVVKIGSNVLSGDDGNINLEVLKNIASQVDELMNQGKQIIIVSSGAGICGATAMNKWSRRGDINYKQALCSVGQVELMLAYKEVFKEKGRNIGQMLVTRGDFTHSDRTIHIRNTLFTLVDEGVIPIVNENDTVSVEEIKIGDNDTLSALTTNLWNGNVLVCLSDIDGLFNKNPKENGDAKLIEQVHDIDDVERRIEMTGKSDFGTGGILTKIEAARKTGEYYIPTILLNGKKKDIIIKALKGTEQGTLFSPMGG